MDYRRMISGDTYYIRFINTYFSNQPVTWFCFLHTHLFQMDVVSTKHFYEVQNKLEKRGEISQHYRFHKSGDACGSCRQNHIERQSNCQSGQQAGQRNRLKISIPKENNYAEMEKNRSR